MILMDKLIFDFPKVIKWIDKHLVITKKDYYSSALPRSTSIIFDGTFKETLEFLNLEGARRALIAYWSEASIGLKERNTRSTFARYHNWNAAAEINSRLSSEFQ